VPPRALRGHGGSVILGFDISALSGPELKRLLALAKSRGQGALAQQLEAELATRGRGEGRQRAAKIGPEAEGEAWEPEPMRLGTPLAELERADLDAADLDLGAPRSRPPRHRRWPLAAAVAALAGGALAWALAGAPDPRAVFAAKPAPVAPPRLQMVRVAPAPAAAIPPDQADAPQEAVAPPPAEVRTPPPRLDPCARPPTPADRLVCNDLALDMLDHELKDAYARALAANADPAAVREAQAAWRQTRDPVDNPQGLAQLYDQRIRELKAAEQAPALELEPK